MSDGGSVLKICPQCGTEYPANERFCPRDGTALRSQGSDTDLVGTIIGGRYHVMKKLGEGGMGQVYLAEHVKMGRKSAVKVMNPGMVKDVDAVSRFNREAANASRINHPNVAGIYDFGETAEGVIYLAMEFIEGQSLTKLISEQGALVPIRAAEITRQAADGLAVAHDMGIVHRDLKPDNIMIARTRDGGDLVKVVDFGIAKAAGSEAQKVTKTGLVVGTPEYMSPEQLSGDKLDGRSDIYSLGLVAFNMLTGKLPFPSDSMQETMIMRLTDRPKTLADMRPEVAWPADVQAVMDKALERDVSLRYTTASQFGVELYKAVERMPATKMVELGTQVMGAAAAAASARTEAIPATRISGPDDLAPRPSATAKPVATPAKKSMMMPMIGMAAVVLIGAGVAYKAMGSPNPSPATTPTQPASAAGDSGHTTAGPGVNPTANPGGTSQPPTGTKSAGSQLASGSPGGGASGTMSDGVISKQLDSLDDVTTADGTGQLSAQVIARVHQLRARTTADSLQIKAQIVEIEAEGARSNNSTACALARSVKTRWRPPQYQKYQALLNSAMKDSATSCS